MACVHYGVMCSNGAKRVVMVLVTLLLVLYIVVPKSKGPSPPQASTSSCPCDCDCIEEDFVLPISLESVNNSYADCSGNDPAMKEEASKGLYSLVGEEVDLQRVVANETLQRTNALITNVMRAFHHYQEEAEKCHAQMETCETARERAEAELAEEIKLTELWKKRALQIEMSNTRAQP